MIPDGASEMKELIKEVEEYLVKQRERVIVPVKRIEQQLQAEAQETVEEAYERRLRELGW